MKSFINDVADNWSVELEYDPTLSQFMPMLNLTLVNTGDSKVEIYMHGQRIGSCFGYSVFSMVGKPFETFRVTGTFNIGDIEVIVSKMVTVAVMPYNPQIDLMEENLDKFASGTDTRISYSSTISGDAIKYILNSQDGLVVQRKLDVLGGASVGSYEVDFNGDIVSGSTAINFPSIDLKRYKKTIPSGTFDYTLTNCLIKGWMFDYKKKSDDQSENYSLDDDPGNGINAYDDKMDTVTDTFTQAGSTPVTHFEVSFPSVSITSAHIALDAKTTASHYDATLWLKVNGSWSQIYSKSGSDTAWSPGYAHITTGWDLVTGLRVQLRGVVAETGSCQIRDISLF